MQAHSPSTSMPPSKSSRFSCPFSNLSCTSALTLEKLSLIRALMCLCALSGVCKTAGLGGGIRSAGNRHCCNGGERREWVREAEKECHGCTPWFARTWGPCNVGTDSTPPQAATVSTSAAQPAKVSQTSHDCQVVMECGFKLGSAGHLGKQGRFAVLVTCPAIVGFLNPLKEACN